MFFTNNIFKWKPSYSIDVVIKEGLVYVNASQTNELELLSPTLFDHKICVLTSKINYNESDIVECDIQKNKDSFLLFPMRVRLDKNFPNTLKTVKSSFESVIDKVTIETLIEMFQK